MPQTWVTAVGDIWDIHALRYQLKREIMMYYFICLKVFRLSVFALLKRLPYCWDDSKLAIFQQLSWWNFKHLWRLRTGILRIFEKCVFEAKVHFPSLSWNNATLVPFVSVYYNRLGILIKDSMLPSLGNRSWLSPALNKGTIACMLTRLESSLFFWAGRDVRIEPSPIFTISIFSNNEKCQSFRNVLRPNPISSAFFRFTSRQICNKLYEIQSWLGFA